MIEKLKGPMYKYEKIGSAADGVLNFKGLRRSD